MLKTMRASFHQLKWTLFAVIIVFILGFVFFSGSDWGGGGASQDIARIGSDQVSAVEFSRIYENQVQREGMTPAKLVPADRGASGFGEALKTFGSGLASAAEHEGGRPSRFHNAATVEDDAPIIDI